MSDTDWFLQNEALLQRDEESTPTKLFFFLQPLFPPGFTQYVDMALQRCL